jgi:glucose-6-phosphate isomerase
MGLSLDPGALGPSIDAAVARARDLLPAVLARDVTRLPGGPAVRDRLGWVDAPSRVHEAAPGLLELAADLDADGVTDVVLVGMGGSSLYPEVLERAFGPAVGAPRLWVLDSTDPAAVLRVEREVPWTSTLLVPASKSGTTVEVMALLARMRARLVDAHGRGAGAWVVPITDPCSPLDARAVSEGFRCVVHGQPDVGGRFSALTPFGLFPAALLGIDPVEHVAPAARRLEAMAAGDGGAAELAGFLAACAAGGRDKLVIVLPPEIASFGPWLEQLVAESLGKAGGGLLPVLAGRPRAMVGDDRAVVTVGRPPAATVPASVPTLELDWTDHRALAASVIRWEVGVALAGMLLGIDPFDQPDVTAAKEATARVLADGSDLPPTGDPRAVVSALAPGGYLAILAYVDPHGAVAADLVGLVDRLQDRLDVPVTLGIGPRYLHSTGQAHKGGRPGGTHLVVVGDDPEDAGIPDAAHGFSRLKRAQAAGDLAALAARGRTVMHARVEDVLALA